jgi:hypothetical protein
MPERGPNHPRRYENTATHCHCGAPMQGSDHCPACQCEEFECGCDENNRLVAIATIDNPRWVVYGEWHGAIRAIFTGTVYQCAAFIAAQESE